MMTRVEAWRDRAASLFQEHQDGVHRRTDRLFAGLMLCQWLAAIACSLWLSPRSWAGSSSSVHLHVYLAVLLGGLITALPVALTATRPGSALTRHCTAVCQMLMSALLIHLMGGRIETHFHVFGSLAFLSFYRDWKVLVSATVVVAADHFLRGLLVPLSVYGEVAASSWRWLEHSGWVLFEDGFLAYACRRSVQEMREIADRQALIEFTKEATEQQVVERTGELQRSERLLRAILASAADGIVGFDGAGKATFANVAAERLLARDGAQLVGQPIEELCGAEPAQELRRLDGGVVECRALRPDGSSILCELTCAASNGDAPGVMVVSLRDVTQRKDLQSQLAASHKLQAIGQLASGIAHEINTPTQYIGDNVRFLREAFDDVCRLIDATKAAAEGGVAAGDAALEPVRELLDKVDFGYLREECPLAITQTLDGVERVTRIVYSMKEFAHPDRKEKESVDLNRVITSATTVCRNEWKYVADLELDLDPALPTIEGFAGDLGQVILNLVVNAAHAIGEATKDSPGAKGRIVVRTRLDGEAALLEVEDTGAGIPEHVKPRIFEQFFTTKEVGRGTGQGLALVHRIVDRHGGKVSFDSTVGKGTTFRVRLSACTAALAQAR